MSKPWPFKDPAMGRPETLLQVRQPCSLPLNPPVSHAPTLSPFLEAQLAAAGPVLSFLPLTL